MRSMWNGTLHLAELAIPIGLVAGKGRSEIQLKTLHRVCRNELEQTKQCPIHGEVPDDELVKGWESTPGEYVLLEADELEAAQKVEDDHRLDVVAVVPANAIDPTMVLNTYFVKPGGKGSALKPYALLVDALTENDSAVIVRFVAWRSEHVAAIRPVGTVLIAQSLVAAEDVRVADPIAAELQNVTLADEERDLGRDLVERMLVDFDAAYLANARRQRLKVLVEEKLTGDGTVRAEPVTEETRAAAATAPPADLADALRRSLEGKKKPRRRRQPVTA